MSAFDDYLNAPAQQAAPSFDAYLGAPVPASAAGGTGAAPVQTAAGQPNLNPPPLGGFLTGVGDAVKGTTQALVHGIAWGANKIAPDSQFAKDANASLPQMQAAIDQQNQAYAAQRAAAQPETLTSLITGQKPAPGIDWSRIAGNIVGTAPSMALGPEFAGLSLPAKIGVGAMQGAAGAGMMPASAPTDDNSYAQQKLTQMGVGGALGAAAPLAFAGAGAAGKGLWNVVQPVIQPGKFVGTGMAAGMSAEDAALAAQRIRDAQQYVPGSMPTTAQAGGTPYLVQTEKAAGNQPAFKTGFAQRSIDNNDARWNALMGVAQSPEALKAAQDARSAAAGPLYDAAHGNTANVGPAFMRMAQLPEMQQAMQTAQENAALQAGVGRGVAPQWPIQATPGVANSGSKAINGAALDYTGRALGDMVGDAASRAQTSRAGALGDLKNWVDSWAHQYVPGLQDARNTYQAASVPINTMEAAQKISNSLGTRAMNAGVTPEIQLNPYRTALNQAMNGADYGIDPAAHATLQGIGQDLQRATVSNSIKSPGSDSAYNLAANGWLAKNLYGSNFQGASGLGKSAAAAAALLMGHPMAAGGIMMGGNKVGQVVGGRLQSRLSDLLLNPQAVLPYLDARAASAAGQAGPGPAMKGLLNYGRPAVVNGLLSNFLNPAQ